MPNNLVQTAREWTAGEFYWVMKNGLKMTGMPAWGLRFPENDLCPEVYIIFLPAAGMVSMILPTMARTPLVGYRWVVGALLALIAIVFTGLPALLLRTCGM